MNDLISELREWNKKYSMGPKEKELEEILSRHENDKAGEVNAGFYTAVRSILDAYSKPDGINVGELTRRLHNVLTEFTPAPIEGKAGEYPDTQLYTWEEVQGIMKKSTPAPVERDGLDITELKNEVHKLTYDIGLSFKGIRPMDNEDILSRINKMFSRHPSPSVSTEDCGKCVHNSNNDMDSPCRACKYGGYIESYFEPIDGKEAGK